MSKKSRRSLNDNNIIPIDKNFISIFVSTPLGKTISHLEKTYYIGTSLGRPIKTLAGVPSHLPPP